MAINLDAIQKRLQEMQQTAKSGGNSGNKDLQWKPPVGKSQIRIVPYAFDGAVLPLRDRQAYLLVTELIWTS
jgi:hypothetical protein